MKIVIVGAGPSGLMCAVKASENVNNQVIVLEKNDKVGKKLYITGKGRCNVCNNSSTQEILQNIVTNNKFMISSLNLFSSTDVINFFETNGTKFKTELNCQGAAYVSKNCDKVWCNQDCPLYQYHNRDNTLKSVIEL